MAADSRRYPLNAQLDIGQILLEAQNRWLRPNEVCEILRNYQKFNLTPDPPYRPQGGSLFLFDRKALRYFRKDGHNWRKKKDGKTVREAHEKLKAGSIDVLHCYYAHGEENENFQRRSYWMLEGDLEHIVLVHYREVKEGTRSGVSRSTGTESSRQISLTAPNTSPACSAHANSTSQTAYTSSPSTADWNGQSNSPEYEDADSGDEASASVPPKNIFPGLPSELQENHETSKEASGTGASLLRPYSSGFMDTAQLGDVSSDPFHSNMLLPETHLPSHHHVVNSAAQHTGITDFPPNHVASQLFSGSSTQHDTSSFSWPAVCRTDRVDDDTAQRISLNQSNNAVDVNRNFVSSAFDGFACNQNHDIRVPAFPDAHFQAFIRNAERYIQVKGESGQSAAVHQDSLRNNQQVLEKGHMAQVHLNNNNQLSSQTSPDPRMDFYGFGTPMEVKHAGTSQDVLNDNSFNDENGGLRKLDSFGRWMSKEIGGDCDSLMASDSGNYWNALDDQNGEKEVSSLSRHMQLDVDSLGPSLSQEQLFSIIDFSPDWSYSDVEAKVLITGNFLGTGEFPGNVKWCCMFGEQEVPAEVVTNNVLRCQAPPHGPGRVPFYVTCSNRLACSEIREFEYREKPSSEADTRALSGELADEKFLQIRFAKMLVLSSGQDQLDCCVESCEKCKLKNILLCEFGDDDKEWLDLETSTKGSEVSHTQFRDLLMQKMLKERLVRWLGYKVHEEGKGPNVLDDKGQGVIHLSAALGYDWAIRLINAAGVNPNFRDLHGRTALHWAAYYGREETVVALVHLGAAPGALEDPTAKFPGGRTAADLASSKGHKGIAGYLAEADLTSHLSSITLRDSALDGVSATLAVDKAMESVEEQSLLLPLDVYKDNQLSLKESLAAVRNSAQAAARIQAAFRVHSFRQRQLAEHNDEGSDSDIYNMVNANMSLKMGSVGIYEIAATSIQKKYRGWKGRRDFVKIRDRVVKIQAHVRGHQVRKQYKKVVWSVGIVEKAILRWRRKGAGLRGFRADATATNKCSSDEKGDEYDFLRAGRKQKVAGLEKALARVQSMVRYPEARDQYMRLVNNFQKTKLGQDPSPDNIVDNSTQGKDSESNLLPMTD